MIATKGSHVTNSYLFEVTPDVAKRMLESNYDKNRAVSKKWVTQLATMMRNGSYVYDNGNNAIIVDESGTLYDGQHRLMAVIEAGVTQLMRVNVVDDGEAIFETLDNGRMRWASHFVGINEAAIAKIAYCIEHGTAGVADTFRGRLDSYGRTPARLEVTSYYQQHKDEVNGLVSVSRRMYKSVQKGPRAVYAGFVFLLEWLGEDPADFIERFCSDEGNEVSPVKFSIVRKDKLSQERTWMTGTLLQGFEMFKSGQKIQTLNKQVAYVNKYNKRLSERRRVMA